ncbi:hypothetical protein [Chitinimonas sp.]|uniref:hypothetical protein n=1 Tax=Chitinimonas sp. TaxID=1934313 RepID=UPI0035B12F14
MAFKPMRQDAWVNKDQPKQGGLLGLMFLMRRGQVWQWINAAQAIRRRRTNASSWQSPTAAMARCYTALA